MIQSKTVSVTEEKRIIIGLITSSQFIKEILPIFHIDYFVNSYLKTIANWCVAFYDVHKKAPFKHIQDIFESESHSISESDSELIEELLKLLSEQYDPESINVQYLKDSTINYFRRRELEIVVNNVSVLKEKGNYDEAEEEISKFTKVASDLDSNVLINIGDINQIAEIYEQREKEDKYFFKLPGDLGRYLGNFKRGDVVGYYAPAKRGKSVWKDSLVYLADGRVMKIKDVVRFGIKDIFCMDKNHNIIKGEIIDWLYSGVKTKWSIKVKSGRLIHASKDHRYYTPTGWKRAHELKIGDRIALTKFIPCLSDKSINVKKLKILAYLIADGHLANKQTSFTKSHPEIMQDFIDNLPISDSYRFDNGGIQLSLYADGKVSQLIDKCGLRNKLSEDKFIPDIIMQANNESMAIFLNTLFTCDGSIWKDKNCVHIDYSTKSHLLAQQILCCLSRFNIFGKLRERVVNEITYYEIIISSNQAILDFVNKIGFSFHKARRAKELTKKLTPKRDYVDCIPAEFVQEAGLELIENGLSLWRIEKFGRAYKNNTHCSRYTFEKVMGLDHKYLNTDILWDEIISIEKKEKVPMYDLSIKDNHNFIVDSFIVHNSYTLVDHYKHGILQKKKTLFWSIEMTKTEIIPRILKTFVPMTPEEGMYKYPVFDCIKNQTGNCGDRESGVVILDDDGFMDDPTHKPCIKCMKGEKDHTYEMTVYHKQIYRKADDIFTIQKAYEGTNRGPGISSMLNKYGRVSVHPKYTLSYDKMRRDIEVLDSKENFIPDIFIIDYIDILDTHSRFDNYKSVDEAWKLMAKLAGEFNVLVITATQANKLGHSAQVLDATHQGGYYGKNQHVNLMVGINQSPGEKEVGIIKYGISEARSQFYIPGKTCTVLQDLHSGQVYLDSFYDFGR